MAKEKRKKANPTTGALPLVTIHESPEGGFLASVNGHTMTPAPFPREELGQVVSDLVATIGGATRVEIHDASGVHVDIVQPPPAAETGSTSDVSAPTSDDSAGSTLVEFSGDGFSPGEEVAVAPLITGTSADEHGRMRMVIDYRHFHENTREVLLYGYISGATKLMTLPDAAIQSGRSQ